MKKLYIFAILFLAFGVSSCEQNNAKRSYEEISIPAGDTASQPSDAKALLQQMLARGEDPHAFLKDQQNMDMAQAPMPAQAPTDSSIGWTKPSGWSEKPAGGMRAASFSNPKFSDIDVSIVVLGGEAGGLLPNVNRWLGQLKFPPMDVQEFETFMEGQKEFKTDSGITFTLIDFATLKAQDPASAGMLAAVFQIPDQTVFVKMTGSREGISANREAFEALSRSIRTK